MVQHLTCLATLCFPFRTAPQASLSKRGWTSRSEQVLWSCGTSCLTKTFARAKTHLESCFLWSSSRRKQFPKTLFEERSAQHISAVLTWQFFKKIQEHYSARNIDLSKFRLQLLNMQTKSNLAKRDSFTSLFFPFIFMCQNYHDINHLLYKCAYLPLYFVTFV